MPAPAAPLQPDSDRDGLSDALEQQLLLQFLPTFMVGKHDCSSLPAAFQPASLAPQVQAQNGTIYAQVSPAKSPGEQAVEIHYYHLWQKDCGPHGHPLDTEHVAVLVQPSGPAADPASWKATYWYAAAHENTVCDVSQIARASTLHAERSGATVWISPGKHASYLDPALCQKGCGADQCTGMTRLVPAHVVNLGEPGAPMNGATFIASPAWPLQQKMSASNFPLAALARLNQLPPSQIAWFNPGRHPVQGIIATSSSTEEALATSQANTAGAVETAGASTGDALSSAGDATGAALANATGDTGNSLQKTYRHTRHALGASVRQVGKALHLTHSAAPEDRPQSAPHP